MSLRLNTTVNLLLTRFANLGTASRAPQVNTQIQQALRNANQPPRYDGNDPTVTARLALARLTTATPAGVTGLRASTPTPAADLLNPQTLLSQLARISVFPVPPQGVARGESYSTTQSEGRIMSASVFPAPPGSLSGLIGTVQRAGTAYQTFTNASAQVRAPQFPVPALAARPALVQRLLQQNLSRVR